MKDSMARIKLATTGALLAIGLSLSGCASITGLFAPKIEADLAKFTELTAKYGTPGDQSCGQTLSGAWGKLRAIIDEPTPDPAVVSEAYKALLVNRVQQQARAEITQNCGQFAAELMVVIGRVASRF